MSNNDLIETLIEKIPKNSKPKNKKRKDNIETSDDDAISVLQFNLFESESDTDDAPLCSKRTQN